MRLRLSDYAYLLASCAAAVWQAWCFNSSKTVWLIVPMGLPFALATYAHAFSLNGSRPSWRRIVVLWGGMPLSMLAAALLMAAETGGMYVAGFGVDDLPFLITRFLIGMSAGCLLWTGCLIVWCQRPRHNRFLIIFVFLYAGVLLSYGVYCILQRLGAEKTNYLFFTINHRNRYFCRMFNIVGKFGDARGTGGGRTGRHRAFVWRRCCAGRELELRWAAPFFDSCASRWRESAPLAKPATSAAPRNVTVSRGHNPV